MTSTHVKNYFAFKNDFSAAFDNSKVTHKPLTLMLFDIDHFKQSTTPTAIWRATAGATATLIAIRFGASTPIWFSTEPVARNLRFS